MNQVSSSRGVHETAQIGFSKPDLYEKVWPSYPNDAIEHCILLLRQDSSDRPLTLVDLGAGTGKLTRCLVPHIRPPSKLVAIEPVPGMRQVFSNILPEIEILDGSAESVPFRNESLDGFFIGQAFHWFAKESSLKEFHRVLKPGALVCMIWNCEDRNTSEWVHEVKAEYVKYEVVGCPQYRHGKWREAWKSDFALHNFTPLESREWKWDMFVNKEYIWDRVACTSYIAALELEEFKKLESRIKKIIEKLPQEGNSYPHATEVAWAYKK